VLSKEHPKNESDGRARIGGDSEEVLLHHRTILVGIKYVSIPFNVEDIYMNNMSEKEVPPYGNRI
jgi:hypothetical protein